MSPSSGICRKEGAASPGPTRAIQMSRLFYPLLALSLAAVFISFVGCSGGAPSPGSPPLSQVDANKNVASATSQSGAAARRRAANRKTAESAAPETVAQLDSPGTDRKAASPSAPTPTKDDTSAAPKGSPPPAESVTVTPSPVGPESWATFRNGNRQLGIAKTTLPEKLDVLWEFSTSDGVVACSAIVGDQVYVPCLNGELVSVDRRTGKRQWSYRSIESKNPNDFAPGFKAAPTVANDIVYIGDEDGLMHAVDRRTGNAKWKFRTGAELAGSVALFGDKLVFGSHDSFLYCLKAADHSLVWKPFQTENFINCSTAIEADNTFIAGCDTKVRVINLVSGKQVSEVPLGEGAYLIASPAVLGDILYVGTHDGRVVAVDWRKQKIVWTYTDPNHALEYRSSCAVTDKFVILGGYDKELHCLDRKTGNQVWNFKTRARIESSPVVVGERVYFGSGDGNLYAVSLNAGKPLWKYRCGHSITASPAVGEHCLVIGSDVQGGSVYCFGSKGT
jgi:eukaryotic-like serine/threonine-protein kinase